MNNLQAYIHKVQQHGDYRAAFLIASAPASPVTSSMTIKALRYFLLQRTGRGSVKYGWFITTDGLVLLVSGSRHNVSLVENHLQLQILDDCQESELLYKGRGVEVFKDALQDSLSKFDGSGSRHSFGGSQ